MRARTLRTRATSRTERLSVRSADEAGLRYESDDGPGIRRVPSGKGFRYVDRRGRPVRDAATLARIRSLAIPPAYREVWISPDPRGHVQATGRDARGRKQYRYHPRWRTVRDETKFDRMRAFSRALPAIRRRVRRDLARAGLPKAKVVAVVVRLLEMTHVRVGNEEYARDNASYGLTTLRDGHAAVGERRIVLAFRGKLGKRHRCELSDRRLARVVARCQALPGQELFQYVDERGRRRAIGSGDVNAYLRAASGGDFTAKDFRTWWGTLRAAAHLRAAARAAGAGGASRARRKLVLAAIDAVADELANTRTVARKYYVHPRIVEEFERGTLERAFRRRAPARGGLSAEERVLVAFLENGNGARGARARKNTSLSGPRTRRVRVGDLRKVGRGSKTSGTAAFRRVPVSLAL